ncbi:MAG TPA: hypothetical protein VEY92_08660 [Pseudoxanthomonas sp.]|nr:hypothetical protein [Pseudoxanthomonas sp.]
MTDTPTDAIKPVAWLCTYGEGEPCLTAYTNQADAAYCQRGWGGKVEPLIPQSAHNKALSDLEVYYEHLLRAANADRARLEAEVLRLELAAGAEWERARVAEATSAASTSRAADYRNQLLAALESAASAESKFHAVYAHLWKVAPWSESNDMDWSDEMICGIDLLLHRAEAAEAALAAANARADEWQPIETAPVGATVLLLIEWSDVPVVGTWDGKRVDVSTEHHETSCGSYCYGGQPSTARDTNPTHWRPLPPPPAAKGDDHA